MIVKWPKSAIGLVVMFLIFSGCVASNSDGGGEKPPPPFPKTKLVWKVTTIAGSPGNQGTDDGIGSSAKFHYPSEIAIDDQSNLYVANYQYIRIITNYKGDWGVPW